MSFKQRTQLGEHSVNDNTRIFNSLEKTLIYIGEVRSIDDPLDSMRIKVRIKGVDDKLSDDELPFCDPALTKFIFILPKVGEAVKIYLYNIDKKFTRREWNGPIISQFQRLSNDPLYYTALSNTEYGEANPLPGYSKIPDADGVYPDKEDIVYQGRDNTDIIFKPRRVVIRAGKFMFDDNTKLNNINPAYIDLQYSEDGKKSLINIVATKINLISHTGNPKFDAIIAQELIDEIEKNGYSLVRGELLVRFLKLMVDFVVNHIHPYATLPPNKGVGKVPEIANFDLNSILATNHKVN